MIRCDVVERFTPHCDRPTKGLKGLRGVTGLTITGVSVVVELVAAVTVTLVRPVMEIIAGVVTGAAVRTSACEQGKYTYSQIRCETDKCIEGRSGLTTSNIPTTKLVRINAFVVPGA